MSGDRPTVSISIPCYNEEEWIATTIESVLGQTFEEFELVIVDDGSTDGTEAVVSGYTDDHRVRYVYQENAGVATAQNTGIEEGDARYYAIMEADDLWEPRKLQRHVGVMEETGAGMTHSNAHEIDGEGTIVGEHNESTPPLQESRQEFLRELFLRNFVCTPTVVLHESVVPCDRPFDESFSQSHDHDMWLRVAADHDVSYLDETLARKRYHGGNLSGNYEQAFRSRIQFVEKAVGSYTELAAVEDTKRASIYLTYGIHLIADKRLDEGRKAVRTSLRHDPTNWKSYATYLLSFFGPDFVRSLASGVSE